MVYLTADKEEGYSPYKDPSFYYHETKKIDPEIVWAYLKLDNAEICTLAHEMGHHATRHSRASTYLAKDRNELICELEAWLWAIRSLPVEIIAWDFVLMALSSYCDNQSEREFISQLVAELRSNLEV